jgi:hypothetical protein
MMAKSQRVLIVGLALLLGGFAAFFHDGGRSLTQSAAGQPAASAGSGQAGAQTTAYQTDALGYIPYWIGVGTFPIDTKQHQKELIDAQTVPDEAALAPVPGDTLKIGDKEGKWKCVIVKDGTTTVDGDSSFAKADNVLVYLVAYVVLDKDEPEASAYWTCDDNAAVFINGKKMGEYAWDSGHTASADSEAIDRVALKKGVNTILVKLINMGMSYGVSLRLADSNGDPLSGAKLVMAPAGKTAPADAAWPVVKTPPPVAEDKILPYIIASQIGYNADEEKLAVAIGKKSQAWDGIRIHDAKTRDVVFTIPKDGGSIKRVGFQYKEGEYVSRIYFGPFKTPGRYYLSSADDKVVSLNFNIADNVFTDAANAITKAFYFWRQGQDFTEKYAGKWAGPAFHSRELGKKGQIHQWNGGAWTGIGGKVLDPTERDVNGGWYDAGDPNKYMSNTVTAHSWLLLAYDMNKPLLKDGELNIPESGNNIPDLLDEIRYGTEFLLKMQRADGAVFDRVSHNDPVPQIAEPCSGATLMAISAYAWAAAVWQENGLDKEFAARCLAAAEKSLKYMEDHPAPWPVDDKGKLRNVGSISGGYFNLEAWSALNSATMFRATGQPKYRQAVEDYLKSRGALVTRWDAHALTWVAEDVWVVHNYMLAKGADPAVVADAGKKLGVDAAVVRDEVSPARRKHLYGSGSRDGYYWGVNSGVSTHAALMAWWASKFAPDADADKVAYAQAAGEYFQFLLGRQASRWCFVTSLQGIGAEHSLPGMFSFMSLNKRDDLLPPTKGKPNRLGMFPGFIVGGPAYGVAAFDFVADDSKELHNMHWVPFEPDIVYQAPGVCLGTYLTHVAAEQRKAKGK